MQATSLPEEVDEDEIVKRYIKSIDKGILKVMSKMGISTYQSYCGAQIFDAVGLRSDFVDQYFFGTATTIEGVGLDEIAEETVRRHRDAFGDAPVYRTRSMSAANTPTACAAKTMSGRPTRSRRCSTPCAATRRTATANTPGCVNEQAATTSTIRGLFRIKAAEERGAQPVPLDEVEPAAEIVKRFSTGAMSLRLDLAARRTRRSPSP